MNQEPFHQVTHFSASSEPAFIVKSTYLKRVGWGSTVFFLSLAVASYLQGQGNVSPVFLAFAALGVFILLMTGELRMNSTEIIYSTPVATYQIMWDEVKKVETDAQGDALVFFANDPNKRMAVIGPRQWSGPDKTVSAKLLSQQIQKRQIPLEQTERALYLMSKNTKVK